MGILDSINNRVIDAAAGYLFGKSKDGRVTVSVPSEVTPIPVVYGRPGWTPAIPSKVLVTRNHSLVSLFVEYTCAEGIQRVPDAVMINDYLDAYSPKYVRSTEEEQKAVLASLADVATGNWADGFGGKILYGGLFRNGFPGGNGGDETTEFQGLASIWVDIEPRAVSQYLQEGELPVIQWLPNGRALHDPRIDPDSFAANYLYATVLNGPTSGWPDYVNAGRSEQIPRWSLGGVAKGWSAENIQYGEHLTLNAAGNGFNIDTRLGQTRLGDSPDNNPALVVLDYLTADIYGAGIAVSDINLSAITDEANYCDAQSPTYAGGPTQAQMSCDITLDTEKKLRENLEIILKTCRGKLAWIDGQYHLHIRKAGQPVAFDIKPRHILKRTKLSYGKKSDRLNRITGTYIEPAARYKEKQIVFPPPQSADFLSWMADDGELLEKEIALDGTANAYRAADLLSTYLLESRAAVTAAYECSLELLQVTAGDCVRVTDDKFTAKLFWVEQATVSFSRRRVVLSLREQDDVAYDNLVQPADITPPGGDALPDSTIIPAPQNVTFTPAAFNLETSGVLSWDEVEADNVTGYQVEIFANGSASADYTVSTQRNSHAVPYLTPGEYVAKVTTLAGSIRSAETVLAFEHIVPDVAQIAGLQLARPFTERGAVLKWAASQSAAFKLYSVEVRTWDTDQLIYVETVSQPYFEYTFAKNQQSGLLRKFKVVVAGVTIDDKTGLPASVVVENTAPQAPVITTSAATNEITISWAKNTDADYVATAIYWRKAGGTFARVELPAEQVSYTLENLDSSATHEIKIAGVDAFGEGVAGAVSSVVTLGPVAPASVQVVAGVNQASLKITSQPGYVGLAIWYGTATVIVGNAVYSGGDLSIVLPGLTAGAQYHIYYRALDKKGATGALTGPITFSTNQITAPDISGLSDWATKIDPLDESWILSHLQGDAIPSSRIANLTAAKLTAGIINATLGIQSGGSIETVNSGYKAGIGVYDDGEGTIYTMLSMNPAGDIKFGVTADGVVKAKGADIEGKVTITGGSGYAALEDKPESAAFYDAFLGSMDQWFNHSGGAEVELIADVGATGGKALRLGNNSGNDQAWMVSKTIIPLRPDALYRVTFRTKRVVAGGLLYAGVTGRDADGNPIAASGSVSFFSAHYVASAGASPILGEWVEYTGYLKAGSTVFAPAPDINNPAGLHPTCVGFSPMFLVGYNGAAGEWLADYIRVDVVDGAAEWGQVFGSGRPANNADVTKTIIDGGLVTTGGIILSGTDGFIRAGKSGYVSDVPGVWLGQYAGNGAMNVGDAAGYLKYDTTNGIKLKGSVTITGGSGYAALSDSPASLINDDSWVPGTQGSQAAYSASGTVLAENRIRYGIGPRGTMQKLWGCWPSGDSSSDGGWNNGAVNHDPAEAYIYGVYLYRSFNTGVNYFGCRYGAVRNLSDGSVNNNPYFVSGSGWPVGEWLLMLGVIHPHNHGSEQSGISGIYRVSNGEKVASGADYKFSDASAVAGTHRAYHFYDAAHTGADEVALFAEPFVYRLKDVVDPVGQFTHKLRIVNPDADVTKTIIDGGLVTTGGIILSGTAGFIRAGKTGYDSTLAGVWMGIHGGAGKLNIGNASEYLKWTGTALEYAGSLKSANGLFVVNGGSAFDDGSEKWVGVVGSSAGNFSDTAGGLRIKSKNRTALYASSADWWSGYFTNDSSGKSCLSAINYGTAPALSAVSTGGGIAGLLVSSAADKPTLNIQNTAGPHIQFGDGVGDPTTRTTFPAIKKGGVFMHGDFMMVCVKGNTGTYSWRALAMLDTKFSAGQTIPWSS